MVAVAAIIGRAQAAEMKAAMSVVRLPRRSQIRANGPRQYDKSGKTFEGETNGLGEAG